MPRYLLEQGVDSGVWVCCSGGDVDAEGRLFTSGGGVLRFSAADQKWGD